MARGRVPNSDRPVKVTINLPESLYNELVLKFLDPLTGKARYGTISNLTTGLLRKWLVKQKQQHTVVESD